MASFHEPFSYQDEKKGLHSGAGKRDTDNRLCSGIKEITN